MAILDNLYVNTLGQHFDNTEQLREATRQGLISEPQYKTMSGYDASQTIPGITDNPLVTGAASGAYNIAKSILSPQDYFNPDTYQPRIGPIDSTLLNIQGSIGLSPQDKEKYEGILALDRRSLMNEWTDPNLGASEELHDFSGVYDEDETGTIAFDPNNPQANLTGLLTIPALKAYFKKRALGEVGFQVFGKGIAQVAMQKKIQAAEATAAQQVRQNIQRYGSGDRPNTGINRPGGGRGQSPTGGDVSGTPFARGGIVNLLYGGFI